MGIKINVDVKKAEKYVGELDNKTEDAIAKAMIQVGAFMEGEVKESIAGRKDEIMSVDTGRFLNSVTYKPDDASVTIKSDVEYGASLEYGTKNRAGRYHFRNSLERNRDKIKEYILNKIKEDT